MAFLAATSIGCFASEVDRALKDNLSGLELVEAECEGGG
jgi:hypothetical protein